MAGHEVYGGHLTPVGGAPSAAGRIDSVTIGKAPRGGGVARTPRLPEDLLTLDETAEALKKSKTTVRRLVLDGDLEQVMIGGTPRIMRPSLLAYVRRQLARSRQAGG
jgi:excisionase family DNA binding protein